MYNQRTTTKTPQNTVDTTDPNTPFFNPNLWISKQLNVLILKYVLKPYTIIIKDQRNKKQQKHKHQTQKWPKWYFDCENVIFSNYGF